jgi:hypothetical protein
MVTLRRPAAMIRTFALAVVVVVAAAACSTAPLQSPSPTPSSSMPPSAEPTPSAEPSLSAEPSAESDPLVVISLRGGECPEGLCQSTTVIERSGRVHRTAPEPTELGTARPDILEVLRLAMDGADFEAIRSVPFTGECPVNFDGQEAIFEFHTGDGIERIASCETEIDPTDPLFAALEALLEALPQG